MASSNKSKIKVKYHKSEVAAGYLTDYDGFKQMNFVGFQNYIDMFSDGYFTVSLKNNILFTLITVPLTLVVSLLLAVGVNSVRAGSKVFRMLFFFPYITSMVAVGIIWTLLFNPKVGPINNMLRAVGIANPPGWLLSTTWALPAIMIVQIWKMSGYYMIIFLAGLQGIPTQLYEAAKIDGANKLQLFFNITLPMLSPTTFLVMILLVINSFQVFDLVSIMTEGGPGRATNVLVYRIYQEGFKYNHFGYASAEAYFLFAIILVVTIIQFRGQKKWVVYQ